MPATTKIESFPAHRLEEARALLAKAHARLVRAAAKAGQTAPAAPELVVLAERVESRCRVCKLTVAGWPPATHACLPRYAGDAGAWVSRELVDLEIAADRPALAGWDFLAAVEPLDGGNLIRQVPGASVAEGELARWAEGKIACDHCGTARRRSETFIVRADGSDPAIAAGSYRQVGRSCLSAFLGGRSPAAIVGQLAWERLVREAGEDGEGGWGGGGGATVLAPDAFLIQTAACVRIDGWCSRSAARADADDFGTGAHREATADQAVHVMVEPFGGDPSGAWRRERMRLAPSALDEEHGRAALAWARAIAPSSDYERNLKLVASQVSVRHKHVGILASAVPAYFRVVEREVALRREREARALAPSRHVGEVGQRLDLELTVRRVTTVDTDYGALHIISMRDGAGNLFVWKTGSTSATPGDRLDVRGTVKKHDDYRGEAQTVLSRCSAALVVYDHPLWPPPAPSKRRARPRKGDAPAGTLPLALAPPPAPAEAPVDVAAIHDEDAPW